MSNSEINFLGLFIDTPVYCIKEETETSQIISDNLSPTLAFKGKNQKHIIMLINYSGDDFLASLEGNLLLKICSSVSLDLDSIALVNINENHSFNKLLNDEVPYERLISFGVNWQSAEVSQQDVLYQAFLRNGKKILKAESLTELTENVASKRALWQELKLFFD